jgi:hypothetical protein
MAKFSMENPVRATTLGVVNKSKEVKINQARIKEISKEWAESGLRVPDWPKALNLETDDQKKMLDYLVILDSGNFCFWHKKERWAIDYNGRKYQGSTAWGMALKKFFEDNPGKGNLNYFSKITFQDFKEMLQGGKNLLLLRERWEIIKKVSSIILKKYGSFENFLESTDCRISNLVPKIYKELPSFDDISLSGEKKIYFLKRAQILCSEIWGAFGGRGIGGFKDLNYLTCFADYRVPQVLNNFGIMEYSNKLDEKIKNRVLIPHNSRQELEIRSATIWATEYLRDALFEKWRGLHSFQIDWILWNKSQEMKMEKTYHLTKTIFY